MNIFPLNTPLAFSTEPAGEHHHSKEDFESYDYVPVGKQIGFDPKLITKLWQSMGSFLHTNLPKSHSGIIQHYSTTEKLKSEIEKALAELERLSGGRCSARWFSRQFHSFVSAVKKIKDHQNYLTME